MAINGNAAAPVKRSLPLNVEEFLARKKQSDAEAAKIKWIPKKERARLQAEKEQEEAKLKVNGDTKLAPKFPSRTAPSGPVFIPKSSKVSTDKDHGATEPDEETRLRYMGPGPAQSKFSALKKRKRTNGEKFKFEWDPEEDTSKNALFPNGSTDDLKEARETARLMEQNDTVNGKERAQKFLEFVSEQQSRDRAKREQDRQRNDPNSRFGIGKHWTQKELGEMRERDWRILREDFQISSRGGSIPNPMRSWKESGLPRRLLDIVDNVGYKDPSPIQRAAIPIALQSRDLIGVAVTGSGKTAAFLLPLLTYISELGPLDESTRQDGPYAIILAPTRELAQQIELEAKKFATPLGFTCVSLVGGHSIDYQSYALRDGAEIVIATPGRLVDCIERRVLVLSQCCYIIMDEADRMIDMGFEEPVNRILSALPVSNEKPDTDDAEDSQAMSRFLGSKDRYRQTMMYTATMPAAVERIARNYLRRPAIVTIGNLGEAVDTVEQRVEFIQGEEKRKKRISEILTSRQFAPPVIVFVNIKRNCDAVTNYIQRMGFTAVTLHGSKTQEQREAALQGLKDHKYDVLVATDLAGRGIDVQDVSLVINFNMAPSIEAYTHRIGRTGRAGKSGVAITFLGNEDADVMFDLRKMIQSSSISRLPDELRRHEAAQQPRSRGPRHQQKKDDGGGGFGGKTAGWE